MLYNKNWDYKVKADPFSLGSLIAWLETKPAMRRYCFNDAGRCLHAQWFRACGETDFILGRVSVGFSDGKVHRIPNDLQNVAQTSPWTFGAALKRARAALTS
jgi:hypothetical protein